MTRRRVILAALLVGCVAPSSAAAQADSTTPAPMARPVAVGDTLRIQTRAGRTTIGVLQQVDSTTFLLAPIALGKGDAPPDTARVAFERLVVMPRSRWDGDVNPATFTPIVRAEVRRGTRRLGAQAVGNGFLGGAAVGTTVGLALWLTHRGEYLVELGSIVVGLAGTAVGTVGGALFAFTPTDNWVAFDPVAMREVLPPGQVFLP